VNLTVFHSPSIKSDSSHFDPNREMLSKCCLVLSVVLILLQFSRACQGRNHEEEQQLSAAENYFAYANGYTPNFWNSLFYRSSLRFVPATTGIVYTN
jgi:hypothetical protein